MFLSLKGYKVNVLGSVNDFLSVFNKIAGKPELYAILKALSEQNGEKELYTSLSLKDKIDEIKENILNFFIRNYCDIKDLDRSEKCKLIKFFDIEIQIKSVKKEHYLVSRRGEGDRTILVDNHTLVSKIQCMRHPDNLDIIWIE